MYYLVHKETKQRVDNISLGEVVVYIVNNNDDNWYLWKKGMENWLHYSQFEEVVSKVNDELNIHNVQEGTFTKTEFDKNNQCENSGSENDNEENSFEASFSHQKAEDEEESLLKSKQDPTSVESYEFGGESSKFEDSGTESAIISNEKTYMGSSDDGDSEVLQSPIEQTYHGAPAGLDSANKEIDRRKHARYDVSLEAVITYEDSVFTTSTINLSWGGIKINNSLPTELDGNECLIYLKDLLTDTSIKFKSVVLDGAIGDSSHIMFLSSSKASLNHLSDWIEKLDRQYKAKKAS